MRDLPIQLPTSEIEAFCEKWKVSEFALFGSVLREDFRSDSDIDVLLTFQAGVIWSLFDRVYMIEELEAIFDRKIDLVNRKGLERSHNERRKNEIIDSARVIHHAAA